MSELERKWWFSIPVAPASSRLAVSVVHAAGIAWPLVSPSAAPARRR